MIPSTPTLGKWAWALLAGYFALTAATIVATGHMFYRFMAWNLLLAFLPYFFVQRLYPTLQKGKKATATLLSLGWFLFFPNAPYMITDFIHLDHHDFYTTQHYGEAIYSTDIITWIMPAHIGMGMFFAAILGLVSLYGIHLLLRQKFSAPLCWAMVAGYSFLSGYAIYIGRVLRFNSWDVLHPLSFLLRLVQDLSPFAIQFSLLYGGYILFTYLVAYPILQKLQK